jgi:NADH-quinone oxidoreductase subunit M
MNGREMVMLVPLAAIVIFLGIFPSPMLNLMNSSLNYLAELLQHAGSATMMGLN